MKNTLRLFFFCFTWCFLLTAFCFGQQAPGIEWQKTFGGTGMDLAQCIIQTADGGYIIAGEEHSGNGNVMGSHGQDYWVIKLNSIGNIQWQKCLGGSGLEYARSIQQTTDNGYVIFGASNSNDGDVTGNHGFSDAWVVKLDSIGNIQWQKSYGGTEGDHGHYMQTTSDGGYIGASLCYSNDLDVNGNHGYADYWVFKLDSASNLQWQKCLGGSGGEDPYSIRQTFDGGYIVTGYSDSNNGNIIGNNGGFDYWVVKLTSTGLIQWQQSLGGTNDDTGYAMQNTSDAGCIVAGTSVSTDGDVTVNHGISDFWIVKLNLFGGLQWQKSLGGTNIERANSIQQTTDGGYIVAGSSSSNNGDVTVNHGYDDYWVVKLNSNGNILWQKSLGGSSYERASSIIETNDGGFIIAGSTTSNDGDVTFNHGDWDYWIVKLYPDTTTGISDVSFENYDLNVFPNPAKDEITIAGYALQNNQPAVLKIYDVMGKEVFSKTILNRTSQIVNLKSFNNGVYFVQLQMGVKVSRVKFIKQ